MRKLAAIICVLASCVCLGILAACGDVAVESVTLDKTAITLTVGDEETLTATVTPDNATDKTVSWSSSDTSVATVNGGKVTAQAEGTATITAKAGEKSATCTVTVEAKEIVYTVTEEEWREAWSSLTSACYKLHEGETVLEDDVAHYNLTMNLKFFSNRHYYEEDGDFYVEYDNYTVGSGHLLVDYNNKICKISMILTNYNGEESAEQSMDACYYLKDGKVYNYGEEVNNMTIEDCFAESVSNCLAEVYLEYVFKDMYSDFTYNEDTKEYVTTFYGDTTVSFMFNDGKLVKLSATMEEENGYVYWYHIVDIYDYGTTAVTVPAE